jgi:ankyrin repeat protein
VFECLRATSSESDRFDKIDFLHSYETISNFLPKSEVNGTISFCHATFREWLLGRRGSSDSKKFVCDPKFGHSAITLFLSRKSQDLTSEDVFDLAHHMLKSQIFRKNTDENTFQDFSAKDLQLLWLSSLSTGNVAADDVITSALSSKRNIARPNLVISKLLLLAGAKPEVGLDSTGNEPLLNLFVARGHEAMASLLMDFGADPCNGDVQGKTPLMIAASKNHENCAKLILGRSSRVINLSNNEGSTALTFAAKNGSRQVLALLLAAEWPTKSGCCREVAIQEALLAAVKNDQVGTLRMILQDQDASVNAPCLLSHEMPLTAAIKRGSLETCQVLVTEGNADLSLVALPLHLAVELGHWSIVDLLLKTGKCDVSAKDRKGRPALVVAAKEGHVAILELLLAKGANLDEDRDSECTSALSWASFKSQEKAVDCLLGHCAKTCTFDSSSRTPLHFAAMSGCSRIVAKLLQADSGLLEIADKNGIRPIDQAIGNGSKDCVAIFLKKGAKLGPTTWAMAKGKPVIL